MKPAPDGGRRGFQRPLTTSHSVLDHAAPDIPDFCRELVAALSEE